jgi:precorrin-3B C17-methyltransferase
MGPGDRDQMTGRAVEVLQESEVIFGYRTYLSLLTDEFPEKEFRGSGMKKEIDRCREAIGEALSGRQVALVSSGDAGVYGMAGLVLELLGNRTGEGHPLYVEIVPGVSAGQAAASLIGAPLMNDYASISLSDLLTAWGTIVKRLHVAAEGDFVIVLINPKSKGRREQIIEAQRILLEHRAGETPVGIVRSAHRGESRIVLTDLAHMLDHEIDMLTTVIVGNSETVRFGDVMVTKRGYTSDTKKR